MNSQQIRLKDKLLKRVTEEYIQPHWKGHFDDWELVKILRSVTFQSGASFKVGEYTLASPVVVTIQGNPYYEILTQFPANVTMKDLVTTGIGPIPARGNFLEFLK